MESLDVRSHTNRNTVWDVLLVCAHLSYSDDDVISCDANHQRKKNKSGGGWRKNKSRGRGCSVEASQGGRWGESGDEECCSVIDFRVVVFAVLLL